MKRVTLLFVGLMVAALSPAHADEASKNAKIREMLKGAKIDQMQTQMLSMMSNQMKSGAMRQMFGGPQLTPEQQKLLDEFQDKLMQLFTQMASWNDMEPTYVKLYAQAFTEEEIDGMLAFYKSPAGIAMVSKSPQLMSEANQVMQQRMVAMQPQLQALMKEYTDKAKAAQPVKQ